MYRVAADNNKSYWLNFYIYLCKLTNMQQISFFDILDREMLTYHAKFRIRPWDIIFDTEEDMVVFILRWS